MNSTELKAAGIPVICDCGHDLQHFSTQTEVYAECQKCGYEDVFIGNGRLH